MRRLFLILTLFSVLCRSQQRAQQPTQPPIVVKVEMPPTNPWVHLVEIVLPGIIGAGIAFLGVWWTNKRNAAENGANREHQVLIEIAKAEIAAKYRSQDNRWSFRKDAYVNLLRSVTALLRKRGDFLVLVKKQSRLKPENVSELKLTHDEKAANIHEYRALFAEYMASMCIATLATGDEALTASLPSNAKIHENYSLDSKEDQVILDIDAFGKLLGALTLAGRKDLWATPETKAKHEAKAEAGPEAKRLYEHEHV
jgi:hypothetical protein